jgi:3'(2'), 5'-bisphosphate nucleotidase
VHDDALAHELDVARAAAREAGAAIMRFYGDADCAVRTKADQSPVTAADEAANECLEKLIRAAFPDDGFLSEESPDDEARFGKRRVWIIDPLDGTRDFLAQTGDFCVLVGLTIDSAPVLGVVYQPVKNELYFARRGGGAFVEADGTTRKLGASRLQEPADVRVGISRLNPDEGLGKCLAAAGLSSRAVQMGASAKHMALARGEIDAVLNLSPAEMEWDTCAPEVVLTEAGCTVTDGDGQPFRYNQKDLHRRLGSVASNGKCHSLMLRVMAPCLPEPAPSP